MGFLISLPNSIYIDMKGKYLQLFLQLMVRTGLLYTIAQRKLSLSKCPSLDNAL